MSTAAPNYEDTQNNSEQLDPDNAVDRRKARNNGVKWVLGVGVVSLGALALYWYLKNRGIPVPFTPAVPNPDAPSGGIGDWKEGKNGLMPGQGNGESIFSGENVKGNQTGSGPGNVGEINNNSSQPGSGAGAPNLEDSPIEAQPTTPNEIKSTPIAEEQPVNNFNPAPTADTMVPRETPPVDSVETPNTSGNEFYDPDLDPNLQPVITPEMSEQAAIEEAAMENPPVETPSTESPVPFTPAPTADSTPERLAEQSAENATITNPEPIVDSSQDRIEQLRAENAARNLETTNAGSETVVGANEVENVAPEFSVSNVNGESVVTITNSGSMTPEQFTADGVTFNNPEVNAVIASMQAENPGATIYAVATTNAAGQTELRFTTTPPTDGNSQVFRVTQWGNEASAGYDLDPYNPNVVVTTPTTDTVVTSSGLVPTENPAVFNYSGEIQENGSFYITNSEGGEQFSEAMDTGLGRLEAFGYESSLVRQQNAVAIVENGVVTILPVGTPIPDGATNYYTVTSDGAGYLFTPVNP